MTPIFEPGEFVHIVDDNRASYCAIVSAATDDGYSVTTATSKATPVPASAVRPGWPAKIDPRVLAVRTDWVADGGPQPVLRRVTDGPPAGLVDAVHLGGNGLVPAAAAHAIQLLLDRAGWTLN